MIDQRAEAGKDYRIAERYLSSHKVVCKKYNSSLEETTQNCFNYPGYIQLIDNASVLLITIKKPIEGNNYLRETDPRVIEE